MKIDETKIIPYFIVIVPLILVLSVSFFMTSFYLNKVQNYFQTAKQNSIEEYLNIKKSESQMWNTQLSMLFKYEDKKIQERAKEELEKKVQQAYEIAHSIYKKYKKKKSSYEIKQIIKDTLGYLTYNNKKNYIFITDYSGNSILHGSQVMNNKNISSYLDADNRSIILEEIQKVRKYGNAHLKSKLANMDEELIYVKDLKFFNWFIGSRISLKDKQNELKNRFLNMIKSIPIKEDEFLLIYSKNRAVYASKDIDLKKIEFDSKVSSYKNKDYYYTSSYFQEFEWNIIYGFDTKEIYAKAYKKQKYLQKMLDDEFSFVIKVSVSIVVFVVFLSLLLSYKLNRIFKRYQDEVLSKRRELQELNSSLENMVKKQIATQREKDKILIQRSKMAEMGDMLSMIAHQWRQPLNQLTYILMNIESAYEYNDLSKEYLSKKIKEGNEQLEYMSSTIDEFRNFFKPDKQKEYMIVDDVVESAVSLMASSLKANNIELELDLNIDIKHNIYKNEFMQVIVNLLKNAKDVLKQNGVESPKIEIKTYILDKNTIIAVCDNGGGVPDDLKDKIFEPYFSTKNEKNGTGLGLYMSKTIINEHHDGDIYVTNTQDGACFKIVL
jgi:C4-dicarboxylate-specific signal transduction histidine kinase